MRNIYHSQTVNAQRAHTICMDIFALREDVWLAEGGVVVERNLCVGAMRSGEA